MREQLLRLRETMKQYGVDYCYIPSDDFHASEYVGEYFKCREYVSGFTGSAGTLIVGQDWAGLWTDGRYFLQASMQLKDSGIELCKMGEPDVPTIFEWVSDHLGCGETLAFDGRTVSAGLYKVFTSLASQNNARLLTDHDLVGEIWTKRPALSAAKVFELPSELVGKSREEKLSDVRAEMQKEHSNTLILSSLMDICWLMNLRGNDVECTPVVLSYCAVTQEEAILFMNPDVLNQTILDHLHADGVTVRPYEEVYEYVRSLPSDTAVMMNLGVINSSLMLAVPQGVKLIDKTDPTQLAKAVKNAVEVRNMSYAHVKDGVAVTRLMYWLKKNVGRVPMDEISVAEKLESLRREQEHYIGPSFHPIMGYGPHGAIIHYSATAESNVPIEPRSFLLADTGGHYLEGTTDITRTFAMGPLTDEEKRFYTLVLKGHLRLGAARFRYGCTGQNLDCLAREPFWSIGMDYNHGTGHGVGYLLAVHEGPQNFRWHTGHGTPGAVLEPGMITSDEPGIYLEGKFGVRIENLTVVCDTETNSYGRFLHLEHLTMVPYDLDAVDLSLLNEDDKKLLNEYHALVRENILPRLSGDEAEWLKEATREV